VSDHGARIGGFNGTLNSGQLIEVQYRHKRARFRVVWIKTLDGSQEKQVGVECVEPEKRLWGVEFPEVMDGYAGNPHK
jgi:regulation of enolase protein 1 (concanavalin A-like superfamily)